jgi:DNA methylase
VLNQQLLSTQAISEFERTLPHSVAPYASRNWGHPLHSLSSYQGKLKPSLAHWLVQEFTKKNSLVVDPLGGVGTIAFAAALLGRRSISSDLSPFPALIAAAKLAPPNSSDLQATLSRFAEQLLQVELSPADLAEADFGLNASVRDYFHRDTLLEILGARKIFQSKTELSRAEKFLFACLIHILHGNRPYALSRCSHPITPFSPTGPSEYRPLFKKLEERCLRLINEPLTSEFVEGRALNIDFRKLKEHVDGRADAIITSPPFPGMRFDRPNWMRLWFCGWDASDFHLTSRAFLERQQMRDISVYREFFSSCASFLSGSGSLIMHIGGSKSYNMLESLKRLGSEQFVLKGEVSEDVTQLEKHGIRDKGLTSRHHLLFFELR